MKVIIAIRPDMVAKVTEFCGAEVLYAVAEVVDGKGIATHLYSSLENAEEHAPTLYASFGPVPTPFCDATMEHDGDLIRCTRVSGHEEADPDPARAFHQHMSAGKPIIRWRL